MLNLRIVFDVLMALFEDKGNDYFPEKEK